jgi:hypothetical protein
MALDTYTNLRTSIEEWSGRNDVNPHLNDFIALTETEMWKKLRIRDMETSAALSVTGRIGTTPTAFVAARSIIHVSGGHSKRIFSSTPQSQRIITGSGVPSNFIVRDNIEFDRTINGAATIEYYASLTGLSSANTSNGVLARFPDIYLFGALMQVYRKAQDSEQQQKYKQDFESAILAANAQDKDGRYVAPAGQARGRKP